MEKKNVVGGVFCVSFLLVLVSPVSARPYGVGVLVACDEEYRSQAESPVIHNMNWRTLAGFQMTLTQAMFSEMYNLNVYINLDFVEWHSDHGPYANTLVLEAIDETGFQSGQNGYHILVVFTGEDLPLIAGRAFREYNATIVQDSDWYSWAGFDQYVDNVAAHEFSHLYMADDHMYPSEEGYYYCVLSHGDEGLSSTIWCTNCLSAIRGNRTRFGYPIGNGGGGDDFPLGGGEG